MLRPTPTLALPRLSEQSGERSVATDVSDRRPTSPTDVCDTFGSPIVDGGPLSASNRHHHARWPPAHGAPPSPDAGADFRDTGLLDGAGAASMRDAGPTTGREAAGPATGCAAAAHETGSRGARTDAARTDDACTPSPFGSTQDLNAGSASAEAAPSAARASTGPSMDQRFGAQDLNSGASAHQGVGNGHSALLNTASASKGGSGRLGSVASTSGVGGADRAAASESGVAGAEGSAAACSGTSGSAVAGVGKAGRPPKPPGSARTPTTDAKRDDGRRRSEGSFRRALSVMPGVRVPLQ